MTVRSIRLGLACAVALIAGTLARADEREHWAHSLGFFERVKDKNWLEGWKNLRNAWVEIKRTKDYVELYDKNRKCAIRLYADRATLKRDSGGGYRKHYDGKWRAASASEPKRRGRAHWAHSRGFFEQVEAKNWVEGWQNLRNPWIETNRTKEYVELYDKSRKCTIRLYADRATLKRDSGGGYRKHYDGKWRVEPEPAIVDKPLARPKDPWTEVLAIDGYGKIQTADPAISPDGKWIALMAGTALHPKLGILDVVDRKLVRSVELKRTIPQLAWSADGTVLAGAVYGEAERKGHSQIVLWNAKTLERRTAFTIPGYASALAISADGNVVAAASGPPVVKVWDASAGKEILSLPTKSSTPRIGLSADGKVLIANGLAAYPGKIVIVDVPRAKVLLTLDGHAELSTSPSGRDLVEWSYGADGLELNVWDLRSRPEAPRVIKGGKWKPDSLRVVDQGRHAILGGGMKNDEIRVYDLRTGKLVREWVSDKAPGGAKAAVEVRSTPDSTLLLTYGTGRTYRLWTLPFGVSKD